MPGLLEVLEVEKADLVTESGNAVRVCEVEVMEDDVLSVLAILETTIISLTKIFWTII